MKRLFVLLLFITVNFHAFSEEIDFPPELNWWLDEIKTVNSNVKVDDFTLYDQETKRYNATARSISGHLMAFPVFMKWNFSGNFVAYYDYGFLSLRLQNSGKYKVYSISVESTIVIADRNKNVFFIDSFAPEARIDSYYWLVDELLTTVGSRKNEENEEAVDLIIRTYMVNSTNRTVEITTYTYKNALTVEQRNKLKLKWVDQREDFFEFDL